MRSKRITSSNDPLIAEFARLHQTYPAEFLGPYETVPESIQNTADYIRSYLNEAESFVECFLNAEDKISALHWLEMEIYCGKKIAKVRSLWVHPDHRGKGFARKLKLSGEAWARKQGASAIRTEVHESNAGMILLNEKLGFVRSAIQMTKKLDSI